MNIHEFLRAKRLEKKLSFRKAAELIGLSSGYISCIEYGTATPKFENLKKFAEGYELNFNELLKMLDNNMDHTSQSPEPDFNLKDILFVIDENGFGEYHTKDSIFRRKNAPIELRAFETMMEHEGFFRVDSGVHVNISHVRGIDRENLLLYFTEDLTGKSVSISFLTEKFMGAFLETIIRSHNNWSTEIHVRPNDTSTSRGLISQFATN